MKQSCAKDFAPPFSDRQPAGNVSLSAYMGFSAHFDMHRVHNFDLSDFFEYFFAQRAFEAAFFDMYVPHSAHPAFGKLLQRSAVFFGAGAFL